MEDEVAKCIAEGIADRILDALGKKVKRQMGDVSKDEVPAGLGKLYFCRVEDLKDNPDTQPIPLGEAVSIKPGMVTYEDGDDGKPERGWPANISFHATAKAEPDKVLQQLLQKAQTFDVIIKREMGKMPRKIKKAYRAGSCYRRDTKWKRKAKAYERRFVYRLPDAEIVVTRQQMGVLEATIKGGSLQSNPDAVVSVSGKDIEKAMAAYVRRKQSKA